MPLGPWDPFLWMLKITVSCGAAAAVGVQAWHKGAEWGGCAPPARTRARELRRRRFREARERRPGRTGTTPAPTPDLTHAPTPPPRPPTALGDSDDEEDGDGFELEGGEDAERAMTTHVVQGVLWGGAVGFLTSAALVVPVLHVSVYSALTSATGAAVLMSPVWAVATGMGTAHIARNLPMYGMRLVLTSSVVVICCGPVMYFWGAKVLHIHSVAQLKKLGAKTLGKFGVTDKGKQLMHLVTNGKAETVTNDHVLLFVSGVRVIVYGHASIIMWQFANRYPSVQRAKMMREGATRGEKNLNEVAIVLTQVVGNLAAGCWFAAAVRDTPGVVASDWLMLWPPYILSYCILTHLQSPSDDHDFGRGVQMWRMAWFGLACATMLPDFGSAHFYAIQDFLGTAGYASWLGTFNGEWQRLCAPHQPPPMRLVRIVDPQKWAEDRRARCAARAPVPPGADLPPAEEGLRCARSGLAIGGQEPQEQVYYLRPDGAPLHFSVTHTVPTVPYETARLRRIPASPHQADVPVSILRTLPVVSAGAEARVECDVMHGLQLPPVAAALFKGGPREWRCVKSVDGTLVHSAEDIPKACEGYDDGDVVAVEVGHCALDPEAPHPADIALLRAAMHRLSYITGYPCTWNPTREAWVHEYPHWRRLKVPGDTGGRC